jgi:hypothetical protein
LNRDRVDAGPEGAPWQVAVADDRAPPGVVLEAGVGAGPGGNLGLDGLGEHPPGPVAEDLGQDVLPRPQGHDAGVDGGPGHG